jgi:hypothetical protein
MLERPVRWRKTFQGCREAITSWFDGGHPIRGWHLFILHWCPSVSRGHATRSCETS